MLSTLLLEERRNRLQVTGISIALFLPAFKNIFHLFIVKRSDVLCRRDSPIRNAKLFLDISLE